VARGFSLSRHLILINPCDMLNNLSTEEAKHMTKSLGFTELELLTILHALDTVMQVSIALDRREDYEGARDVALKLASYARAELERQDIEEAMEQKQRATAQ
jgi:hypothetical protein